MNRYQMKLLTSIVLMTFILSKNAMAGEILNKPLPQWLKVDLEFRYRMEYRNNFDFNDSMNDKDAFNLYRTRLGLRLKPTEKVNLFAQFQDSRIANDSFGDKSSYEHYMDARQLYLELKDILPCDTIGLSGMGIRAGRQELSYGAERLIGGFNWSNIAQTFDAGKITLNFKPRNLSVDFFGGTKTPNKSPREANDFYDGSTKDSVGGYYATWKGIKKVVLENYLINRKTNKNISFGPSGSGELNEYTFGSRIKSEMLPSRFDYEFETAGQWGKFDDKDIAAFMAVGILGYTLDYHWSPRLAFEFDYASGDNTASDGTRRTFDNLYPTNHPYYGYMDLVGLQNLNDYRFQLSIKPSEKLNLQSDLHIIYLDTYKDSLYSASRAVARTATAAMGSGLSTHVGNELDLTAKYKLFSYANILVGYSHFFPGKYLEQTGANDAGDYAYLETTFNF